MGYKKNHLIRTPCICKKTCDTEYWVMGVIVAIVQYLVHNNSLMHLPPYWHRVRARNPAYFRTSTLPPRESNVFAPAVYE